MTKTRLPAAAALFAWALWAGQPAMGQDPVDGVCDESVRNGCSAGTPNAAAYPDEPVVYQWRCDGLNGGRNSGRCALWFSVVGVCDESVRNGCAAGNPNDDAFPDSPTMYAWRCDGLNAGANSGRCHIRVADVVDGVCDDTVRNGCSAGTPNDAAIPDNAATYLWRCDGQRGGANSDKCHIRVADVVDGACDDSVRNGCSAGTANDDAIPDNASTYLWRCDGQRGGANSDKCHIRVADVVDGACDDGVRNGCSAGTANDDAIPDNATTYLWRCDGLRGGRNSDKCHIRVADVVDGVCDDTVRNGCSAGTANDDAFADNSTGYLWRCDGLRGGRNSDKCFIRVEDVPVDGVCDDTVRNGCSAGTANDDAFADNSTGYLWRCDGLHGGRNSDKCFIRVQDVPVDGVCDESVRDGCSAGTANDIAVADTTSHYRWRCDGIHGGSNSGTCTRAKPPVAQVSCGGAWSPSPATVCSGQSFTQRRTCNVGCNDGDCATSRSSTGTRSCPPRPVDGGWSAWNACSATACGLNGTQTRTCNNPSPQHGGQQCLKLNGTLGLHDSRGCTGSAPVNGRWSAWGTCSPNTCGGQGTQTRACDAPSPACGGQQCLKLNGTLGLHDSRSCTGSAPVNGRWSAWGTCSPNTCGGQGTQTRACDAPSPACGGQQCLKLNGTLGLHDSRGCTGSAPVNGRWSAWGTCSPNTCGGQGTQTRACDAPSPACGGQQCLKLNGTLGLHDSRGCTGSAPVNGGWSDWGTCSPNTCGGQGTQTRACDAPSPACGGQQCLKLNGTLGLHDSRGCTGSAPVNGGWSDWGTCSPNTCGGQGTQTRACDAPSPACGGQQCLKLNGTLGLHDSRGCTGSAPVNGGWSDWGTCSPNTCGETGTQERTCDAPRPACGGAACAGEPSRTCTGTAPMNGVWQTGAWRAWGQCIDCQQARSRSVTCDPPSCGGETCNPASKPSVTETQACVGSNPIPGNLCRN